MPQRLDRTTPAPLPTTRPASNQPATNPATKPATASGWTAMANAGRTQATSPVTPPASFTPAAVTTPAATVTSPAPVLPNGANGDFGSLNPTGKVYQLPPSLQKIIKPADQALNLDVMNRDFNPLKAKIGEYKTPNEVFQGKAIIPTRDIVTGALKQAGQAEAFAPVLAALPNNSVMRTPAHEFNVNGEPGITGTPGNRIVFYGGEGSTWRSDPWAETTLSPTTGAQGQVIAHGHKDIDQIAITLGDSGVRLMKQMVHFNGVAQGGDIASIIGDGVGGSTHGGGFSSGYIDGKPTSIFSDWPANYGKLSDDNVHYNAQLLAINYQGGTRDIIPRETQIQYKNNADMWDAVLGAVVPFAGSDPDPRHTNYQYNPLDVYDQASAKSVAHDAASLSWDTFKQNHGAFYCAEGQYVVANLGPQEDTLIKKSTFGNTPLGNLIETFQKAPGVDRQHPEKGWQYLADQGLIKPDQLDRLKQTGRIATYLDYVPEETKGWQAYNPIEPNGMIASPMTVGTLAWSLMRRYLPREGVAAQISQDMTDTWKNGDPQVKGGIEAMLGGNTPVSPAGQKALGEFAFKASTGMIASTIGDPKFKEQLFQQAGAQEITNDADKAKLDALYGEYVNTFMTATNQADLDKGLKAVDDKLRNLQVERSVIDENGQPTGRKMMSTMLYAAPPALGAWAQQPFLAGTPGGGVIQYVATAMHASEENVPAAPAPAGPAN